MVLDLLGAFLVAVLVVWLFTFALRRPGPWGAGAWFFVVVFLGTWAVAAWMEPVGPVWWGVAWLPMLVVALGIGLLLAAATPAGPVTRADATEARESETAAVAVVGAFLWIFLLAVLIAAIAAYL